jgi:hypothetical protein
MPLDGVCDYLGIEQSALSKWVRQGTLVNGSNPKNIYSKLAKKVKRATAEYRLSLLDGLHGNEKKKTRNWYRNLAILERRDRKNFGRYEPTGGTFESYDPDERFL